MGLESETKKFLRKRFPPAFARGLIPACDASVTHIMYFLDAGMMVYKAPAGITKAEFIAKQLRAVNAAFRLDKPGQLTPVDVVIAADNPLFVTPLKRALQAHRKEIAEKGPRDLKYPNRSAVPPRMEDQMEPAWSLLLSDRLKRHEVISWMFEEIIRNVEVPPHCNLVIEQDGSTACYDMHSRHTGPRSLSHFAGLFGEAEFAPLAFAARVRQLQRSMRVAALDQSVIDCQMAQFMEIDDKRNAELAIKHSAHYDEMFDPLSGPPAERLRVVIDSNDGDLFMMCTAATEALRSQNIEVVIRSQHVFVSRKEAIALGVAVPEVHQQQQQPKSEFYSGKRNGVYQNGAAAAKTTTKM